MFKCVHQYGEPVLRRGMPGTEDNKYGFEGGTVIKLGETYHLFTSELADDPKTVKMRLAHWASTDKVRFRRLSTLFESTGDFTGKDERAALWSPMPRYDAGAKRWNLFYVAYRSAPNTDTAWYENYGGRICRAVSQTPGLEGIGGPYADAGVVLQPDEESDPWEGLQGVDSFFPYQADGGWLAFYGSARTETCFLNGQVHPDMWWGVGLARSEALSGPWKRCTERNPVPIHDRFVENPVVVRLEDGAYVAVYDGGEKEGTFGYSRSADGLHWSRGQYVHFRPEEGSWVRFIRTPLCLIREDDGTYTVYYTGFDVSGYGCIGMLSLALTEGDEGV